MQEIRTNDTVCVTDGERKGKVGVVLTIEKKTRTHFVWRRYGVQFDDNVHEFYEGVMLRVPRSDVKPRDCVTKEAKPLGIEKVLEAKPAEEKAPAKPKEETRHAREA